MTSGRETWAANQRCWLEGKGSKRTKIGRKNYRHDVLSCTRALQKNVTKAAWKLGFTERARQDLAKSFIYQNSVRNSQKKEVQRDDILDFGDFLAFNPEHMAIGLKCDQVEVLLQRGHRCCKRGYGSEWLTVVEVPPVCRWMTMPVCAIKWPGHPGSGTGTRTRETTGILQKV